MPLSFCAASHTGVRRANNEDSCCVRPELGLFVVADGVGGYAAGEVASRAAVDAIELAVRDTAAKTERSEWPFDYQAALGVDGNRLNWAFHLANGRIRSETEAGRGRQGMATTVAAVLFECDAAGIREPVRGATIGHVGDSRIYRYRQGALDRLTRDHSWVEEQVQAGFISDRDARHHPRRNLLTRALTGGADPVADLGWVPVAAGDRLLLCSDGLYSVLGDEQITAILDKYESRAEPGEDPEKTLADGTLPGTWGPALAGPGAGRPGEAANDQTVASLDVSSVRGMTAAECGMSLGPKAMAMQRGGVCDALVHAANLGGGPDNITVILVRL